VSFPLGKLIFVTGVSGSGKSTFMHMLGGLDEPSTGEVFIDNKSLSAMKKKQLFFNQTVGFVFQFHYLIKELTVLENIMLVGLIKGEKRSIVLDRTYELLDQVGLRARADYYPTQLSGGEQQRVSILRALFNKPAFLIADEPTGNLDEENANNVVEMMLDACKTWNMGLILCSHDRSIYARMNRVLYLHHGLLSIEK
jgi:ABC-type lipoprotein export system ATPase subunit